MARVGSTPPQIQRMRAATQTPHNGVYRRRAQGFIGRLKSTPIPILVWALWLVSFFIPGLASAVGSQRWAITGALGLIGLWQLVNGGWAWNGKVVHSCGLLVLLTAASSIYSQLPTYSMFRSAAFGAMIVFSVTTTSVAIRDPQKLIAVCATIFVALLVVATGIAFTGAVSGATLSTEGGVRFVAGNLKATGAASIIASTSPFILWGIRHLHPKWRSLLFGLLCYLLFLLLATRGRGGIGTALVVLPFYVGVLRGKRLAGGVLVCLISVAVFGMALNYSPALRQLLRLDAEDITTGRVDRWETLYDKAMDKPLLGYGFGTSRYHHLESIDFDWTFRNNRYEQKIAHNEHLAVFYELGAMGLIAYWSILFLGLLSGYRLSQMPPSSIRDLLLAVFFSWTCSVINTVSHDMNLTAGSPNAYMFWIQLALVTGGGRWMMVQARRGGRRTLKESALGTTH